MRWLLLLAILSARGFAADDTFTREVRPLLEKYCFDCHDDGKAKGGVNLEKVADVTAFWSNPKLWENVHVQLRERVMPPAKKPQPTDEERTKMAGWIHATLAKPDVSKLPRDPGRIAIHRLSRLEYSNTIRDMLGVDTRPGDRFPPDAGGGGGFDNNAATLFIPPMVMEKYLAVAADVIADAKPERLFNPRPGEGIDDRAAAEKNLSRFGAYAFRRPFTPEEIARFVGLYDSARKRGESWEDAVKLGYRAVLISPHFLFRIETDRPGTQPQPIGDWELASRLSYFLWSSMPDPELFRLAAEGKLSQPGVAEAQVKRMLADPKARTFAENFASQWLRTKEVLTVVHPAPDRFPQFTPDLRDALYGEPVEFFHALLRDNLPLTDCLDADYTYANDILAKHYGLPTVAGEKMQRVKLTDRTRGGVITMGGVLALTSYPRRPSPVLRGKWVLEEILGTPPPPPPPLIKSLPQSEKPKDGLTFRQQLERHRAEAQCAGCHSRMDPLGFGLENFDVLGGWRADIAGQPVDATGKLPTGETFNGPAEMKKLLLTRKEEFIRNLTEKMLAYALGRGLENADWFTVRQITQSVAQDGDRAQRLILEVARSYPFRYRRQAGGETVSRK